MSQVERLQGLLARVQRNRLLPREAPGFEPVAEFTETTDDSFENDAFGEPVMSFAAPPVLPSLRVPAAPTVPEDLREELREDLSIEVEAAESSNDEPIEVHVSIAPPNVGAEAVVAQIEEEDAAESAMRTIGEDLDVDVPFRPSIPVATPVGLAAPIEVEVEHEVFETPALAASAPVIRIVAAPRGETRISFGKLLQRSLAARPKSR